MADLATEYRMLRDGVLARWQPRDVIRVAGPDALSFLQGQCSQDFGALAVGDSSWSLILAPQGKVDALVRVSRADEDVFVLDVDGGFGPGLIARLERFKLRVKAEIEPLDWKCLALRGPGAAGAARPADRSGDWLTLDAGWPGLPGVDLVGQSPRVPADVMLGGDEAFDVARIEAGVPAMGAELTERTIPAEAGIVERTVSFTKGCFTGQELVARIDSRGGNVPRHLRGVIVEGDAAAGATILVDGRGVGTLTSAARSPGGGTVALAYVHRDVSPPADAVVEGDHGATPAAIRALPLVP
jgi:folate-binding protein YgfZ